MARFVELNEAATMLGITPEKLVEMRSSGDIHGYRDGGSWKFKAEEIDRVAGEMSEGGAAPTANDDILSFDDAVDGLGGGKDDESILVSEEELGDSAESTSSTIIGKLGEAENADSDLSLVSDSDLEVGDSAASESPGGAASDDNGLGSALDLEEEPSLLGSSLKLSAEEPGGDSDVTLVPDAESDVSLVPDPGSSGILAADSGLGSALDLASGTGGDTGNLPEFGSDSGGSGDMELGSELALSDDDDMVLGGGDTGSDLALGAGDSGISLGSPSDSGLSLEADSGISLQSATDSGLSLEDEDEVDFGGSSISSLELPEDDELVSLDDADEFAPMGVQKDEEFMLSPSDEMMGDESDSGSQVIALEDSEAFDQDAATMLQAAGGDQALLAETAGLEAQLDAFNAGTPATPVVAAGAAPASAPVGELNEAPYSIWNLMGLMMIMLFLFVSGVLMMDIVRNMWAWEEARDVSTSISDGVTTAFGMNKK